MANDEEPPPHEYVLMRDAVRDDVLPPRAGGVGGAALQLQGNLAPLLPHGPGAGGAGGAVHNNHAGAPGVGTEQRGLLIVALARAVAKSGLYAVVIWMTIYHVLFFCGASVAVSKTVAMTAVCLHKGWIIFLDWYGAP